MKLDNKIKKNEKRYYFIHNENVNQLSTSQKENNKTNTESQLFGNANKVQVDVENKMQVDIEDNVINPNTNFIEEYWRKRKPKQKCSYFNKDTLSDIFKKAKFSSDVEWCSKYLHDQVNANSYRNGLKKDPYSII